MTGWISLFLIGTAGNYQARPLQIKTLGFTTRVNVINSQAAKSQIIVFYNSLIHSKRLKDKEKKTKKLCLYMCQTIKSSNKVAVFLCLLLKHANRTEILMN